VNVDTFTEIIVQLKKNSSVVIVDRRKMRRFDKRFPDARSVSGGLEPGTEPIRTVLREIGWQQLLFIDS